MWHTTINTDIGPIEIKQTIETEASAPRDYITIHDGIARPIRILVCNWVLSGFKVKWEASATALHTPYQIIRYSGKWKSEGGSREHAIENIVKECIAHGF